MAFVYELDRGWSFDGYYIPFSADVSWYFGQMPVQFKGVQKVRVYGNSKGRALLKISTTGQSTDFKVRYNEGQIVDLPKVPELISTEFEQTTNIVNLANHGLSIRMRFEGRQEDVLKPEPSHVIQVLVIESRVDNARDR